MEGEESRDFENATLITIRSEFRKKIPAEQS